MPLRLAPLMMLTFLVSGGAGAAPLSKEQAQCNNALHGNWAKVSKEVAKQAERCARDYSKGKPLSKKDAAIDTLDLCLGDDPNGRVSKRKARTQGDFDKRCLGNLPPFGAADADAVNTAATSKELALVGDLFGADLDGTLVTDGDTRFSDGKAAGRAASCQQKLLKAAFKCQATVQAELGKCKKRGLGDGTITDVTGIESCYEGLDPGKVAKRCTAPGGILKQVDKGCVGKVEQISLAELFPGCATDDASTLAACVDRAVACRVCLSANDAEGAARDCDLFDDGESNLSCGFAADSCDGLNAEECLLPYPSTFFLEPAETDTGFRIHYADAALPPTNPPLLAAPFNELDGVSNMVQIQMHFPQGVDPELSDASRLLEAGCCGQPAGPPWLETRTHTDRSLDADSPSVLIDAETGERVLHFIEPDARAAGNPKRQILFLRPGVALEPGTRYIVAMRNLKDPGNADVVAEPVFAALRDQIETTNPNVTKRRNYFESQIFPQLSAAGIARGNLVLAFDFITQSEHQLTHQMLSMRDQVLAFVDAVAAQPGATNFSIDEVDDISDCSLSEDVLWRRVSGTFETPLFLSQVPTFAENNVPQHTVDENDTPVQNGTMDADFDVSIPCSVFDAGVVSRPILLGHGIFGEGRGMVLGVPLGVAQSAPWTYIAGATKWLGLSDGGDGQLWVGNQIIGIGQSALNDFPAFPDRLRQGMANTIALGRMMKLGVFNRDPAFEKEPGVGVFPGPGEEMYYEGISLGGVMGTMIAALTPDIERFAMDVPSANFACLLQRSTQFRLFEALLGPIGLSDPMHQALGAGGLIHDLWVSAEPAGFLNRITSNPFPGSGNASRVLYSAGWLDKQVSNQCTEISARTMGLWNQESVLQGIVGIPDAVGAVDSGMTIYDTGYFDLFDPLHVPNIPPLANELPTSVCDPHNGPRSTEAARLQLVAFLQPDGLVESFCTDGACDAVDPIETPSGSCDPSVTP